MSILIETDPVILKKMKMWQVNEMQTKTDKTKFLIRKGHLRFWSAELNMTSGNRPMTVLSFIN
jgi:hypothetical protein